MTILSHPTERRWGGKTVISRESVICTALLFTSSEVMVENDSGVQGLNMYSTGRQTNDKYRWDISNKTNIQVQDYLSNSLSYSIAIP